MALLTQDPAGEAQSRAAPSARGRLLRQGLIAAGTVVIIAVIWVGIVMTINAHRAETTTAVLSTLSRKALLVEEQLNRQLLVSDQTLRILEVAWQRDPEHFHLESFRGQLVALEDTALQIFITDAAGIVRESTRPEIIGSNVSSRDYFRYEQHLPGDDGGMYINSPVKGLVTQRWQLNLVRRLDYGDGTFGGVVSIALPTSALDVFYTNVDLGTKGMIALVNIPDGGLLAQAGAGATQEYRNIAGSPLFEAIKTQRDGSWTGITPFDRVERIHAFAPIQDRLLTIMVSVDSDEAMGPFFVWQTGVLMFGALATLLMVACAALLLQATRAAYRREDALAHDQQQLRRANIAMEEARRQAQSKAAQLQAALAGMTDGIMMLDADLRVLEWNDNFVEFTGMPRHLMRVGLPMRDLIRAQAEVGEFGPVDPDAEADRRMQILHSAAVAGIVERLRPNGRVVEIRRNLLPGGGFVTLYADITERRVAAERLRQVQTMAAVGRLTAGLAHDFNNLLASITLNAEMLEIDLEEDVKLAQRASIILQATNRGAALVHQLLAFSRKQELVPSLIDINATIMSMREIVRTSIGSTIRLETELEEGLWPVLVDLTQIENVILNLVINARDAMPGGGTLVIKTTNERLRGDTSVEDLPPGDYVTIRISDTGTGMTDEIKRNAFDPFFTTKAAGKGSGLGLSQVYGVTRQSGGSTEIISTPGEGTTIRIVLPRAAVLESAGASKTGAPPLDPARGRAPGPHFQ